MTSSEQTPTTEYFVVRDLGYDGLIVMRFTTQEEADKYYLEEQNGVKEWIEKYGVKDADKGIALIEGKILKSEDIEF